VKGGKCAVMSGFAAKMDKSRQDAGAPGDVAAEKGWFGCFTLPWRSGLVADRMSTVPVRLWLLCGAKEKPRRFRAGDRVCLVFILREGYQR